MKIFLNSTIKSAIQILNKYGVKTLVVLNKKKKLIGTLSDGNIRKSILKGFKLENPINNVFNKNPIFTYEDDINFKKLRQIFLEKKIHLIPVVSKKKIFKKIIFLEDVIDTNYIRNSNQNSNNIGIVIMAGGRGVRMLPYTKVFPKPLLPINDTTVLDEIISKFLNYNMNKFFITTNYKHEMISSHFKNYKPKINYKLIKEKKSLGTAGSLSYLKNFKEEIFLVTNCDVIINENYNNFLKYHIKNKNDLTIIASKKFIKFSYGICLLDKKNKFLGFDEKPNYSFLFNIGFYIINKKELKIIKKNQKLNMDELISKLKKNKRKIGIFEIDDGNWKDFGNWESYIYNNKN